MRFARTSRKTISGPHDLTSSRKAVTCRLGTRVLLIDGSPSAPQAALLCKELTIQGFYVVCIILSSDNQHRGSHYDHAISQCAREQMQLLRVSLPSSRNLAFGDAEFEKAISVAANEGYLYCIFLFLSPGQPSMNGAILTRILRATASHYLCPVVCIASTHAAAIPPEGLTEVGDTYSAGAQWLRCVVRTPIICMNMRFVPHAKELLKKCLSLREPLLRGHENTRTYLICIMPDSKSTPKKARGLEIATVLVNGLIHTALSIWNVTKKISNIALILCIIMLLEQIVELLSLPLPLILSCWTGRTCSMADAIWRFLKIGTVRWTLFPNIWSRLLVTANSIYLLDRLLYFSSRATKISTSSNENQNLQEFSSQRIELIRRKKHTPMTDIHDQPPPETDENSYPTRIMTKSNTSVVL